MNSLLALCTAIILFATAPQCEAYRICGDDYNEQAASQAQNEIIKRLMALRNTDWNWQAVQTPMALQVAAQEKFIGREKTVEAIQNKIVDGAKNMSLIQLGLHTMAVRGLCHDTRNFSGIDLAKMLEQKMLTQFGYQIRTPKDGYHGYAVGLSALCISDYPVKRYLVNKLLASQNNDGSFGTSSSTIIAVTSFLLPPLSCLTRETDPMFRVGRIDFAIKKMRAFLKSKVHEDVTNRTYVGNLYTSTFALHGLRGTQEQGESPDSWKCREVMDTLGLLPGPDEPETHLVSRLLRISGHGYTYFKDPEWKCSDPGPIPSGYRPTCEPDLPATCRVSTDSKQKDE